MAVSRRRLFTLALAAHAVVACSLITDYTLNGKAVGTRGDAGDNSESGTDGASDDGTTVETGPDPGTIIPDEDAGPACSETPCVTQVAPAGRATCALLSDGTVKCWGANSAGLLQIAGDTNVPQTITFSSPLNATRIDQIVVGDWGRWGATACARALGDIECWGTDGAERRLGRPNTDGGGTNATPEVVTGINGATDLAMGSQRGCAIANGKVLCWGKDYTSTISLAKEFPTPKPSVRVYAGRDQDCVLLDSGEIACAGYPFASKELWSVDAGVGPGSADFTIVPNISGVYEIANSGNFICVRKNDGSVWCWGRNDKGQLGRGNVSGFNTTPQKVPLGMAAKRIGSGANFVCAALADASLWCWGRNNSGTNYDGTFHPTGVIGPNPDGGPSTDDLIVVSPRKIDGLPNNAGLIRQIAGGYEHMCVLYQSGALYCWGGNRHGQLSSPSNNNANPTPAKVTF